jgi:hypothetical protein
MLLEYNILTNLYNAQITSLITMDQKVIESIVTDTETKEHTIIQTRETPQLNHFKNAMSTTLALISIASCSTKMYLVETTIAVGIYYIYDFTLVNTLYKIHHIAAVVF